MLNINAHESRETPVDHFLLNQTTSSMQKLADHAMQNDLPDEEIVKLARGLASSGSMITNLKYQLCDIPSTGGPGSLSTLICPLILTLLGNEVLKLGVPGRPAGGIDVLSQISGYQIDPEVKDIENWLSNTGYVHFLANDNFAPLDAKLFLFRKNNNSLNVPSLAIASLLSKKIAVGLHSVGLDVRIFPGGNFGSNFDIARENAVRFNRIANLLNIRSTCFLTDGENPQQPYIGRGESILALKEIFGDKNIYLQKHLGTLFYMAQAVSINKKIQFKLSDIETTFFKNVEMQGGSKEAFFQLAEKIQTSHVNVIVAPASGFLKIDLDMLRTAIVDIQQTYLDGNRFPDPCGIILKKMPNEFISKGDIICTYRCVEQYDKHFRNIVENTLQITDEFHISNELELI